MSLIAPVHLNGNLLCALDVGATGPDPSINEITSAGFIPLRPDYSMSQDLPVVEFKMKPTASLWNHPSNKMSQDTFKDYLKNGIDPQAAADGFLYWFESLNLGPNKRLVPVSHNFASLDRPFLQSWLGERNYEHVFSCDVRDTMLTTLYINDQCDLKNYRIPFPKRELGSVCARLGVERRKPSWTMQDAKNHADVYKALLSYMPEGII